MQRLPRSHLLGYLAVGAAVVVLGALWVRSGAGASSPGAGAPAAAQTAVRVDEEAGGRVVVHVAGAVRHPGVYRLRAGTRVSGAVRRAGGATSRADLDALNLAAKVSDGRQVLVPERAASGASGAAGATTASAPGSAGGPLLNLNAASGEQLATLDGIGPAMAARILAYRQEHGAFASVDELDQVPGIGPKRLAALRDRLTA